MDWLVGFILLVIKSGAVLIALLLVAAYLVLVYVMHAPFVFLPQVVAGTAALAAAFTLLFGGLAGFRALGHKTAPLLRNQ